MNKSYGVGGRAAAHPEDGTSAHGSMIAPLLALAPATVSWSPKVGLVMILANVIAIAIGKATIKQPNVGLQLPSSNLFGGLSHGAMLGTISLGHILGMGAIQGLASRGVL
jgi:photosystem I subunit 10